MRWRNLRLTDHLPLVLATLAVVVSVVLRIHNINTYNTWWADDGGAHIAYVTTILQDHRLPTFFDTYLAWHEPGFYILGAVWIWLGGAVSHVGLDWWEGIQVVVYLALVAVVGHLSWFYSKKNQWIVLASTIVVSFVFSSVKLGTYVTNEYLAQTAIVFLVWLFLIDMLGEAKKEMGRTPILRWSVFLGLALLIKVSAIIVFVAAVVLWGMQYYRTRSIIYLKYIIIATVIAFLINTPWLIYKHRQFGGIFTINLVEQTKQSVWHSIGWQYIVHLNHHVVTDFPFWFQGPHSFWSILLADTFADYYNLFQNVDAMNELPRSEQLLIPNGRYTTPALLSANLWGVRLGAIIAMIWLVGFGHRLWRLYRKKAMDWQTVWLTLLVLGGVGALIYNMLRLPYLDRGTVKIQFILYIIPLLAIVSYTECWQWLKKKIWWGVLVILPLIIYILAMARVLWV